LAIETFGRKTYVNWMLEDQKGSISD